MLTDSGKAGRLMHRSLVVILLPVGQIPFCSSCGREIQSGVKFCPHCGAASLEGIHAPFQGSQTTPSPTVSLKIPRNWLILGVIGLLVISVIVVVVPVEPRMVVTNLDMYTTGSFSCYAHYQYTLVNSGGTGYARVNYLLDGNIISNNVYYVSANGQLPVTETDPIACGTHTGDVQIDSQWPAR